MIYKLSLAEKKKLQQTIQAALSVPFPLVSKPETTFSRIHACARIISF